MVTQEDLDVWQENPLLTKIDWIVATLCTIEPRTPHYVAERMELSLRFVYSLMGHLVTCGVVHKQTRNRIVLYTAFLSYQEVKKGLEKWSKLGEMYPEITEYQERREENVRKNNSIREKN